MIRSMTGYGRAQRVIGGRDITVELRAVNHRFFEFSARVPRSCGYLEEKLKSFLQTSISRGKTEVGVTILTLEGGSSDVEINHALASEYLCALRALGDDLGLRDDMTLSSISRFADIFVVRRPPEDEESVWEAVREVTQEALERFLAMRGREGEKLREDVLGRADTIERLLATVEQRSPETVAQYRRKLTEKLTDLLDGKSPDEQRVLTEAAIIAEKLAVDEETVRLHSHLAQLRSIFEEGGAVGRRLDFLVQEFNREANTIGSKAQDLEIVRAVVDIKSEIEKIREQIQNIE